MVVAIRPCLCQGSDGVKKGLGDMAVSGQQWSWTPVLMWPCDPR